jgi:hypothetical protein
MGTPEEKAADAAKYPQAPPPTPPPPSSLAGKIRTRQQQIDDQVDGKANGGMVRRKSKKQAGLRGC